MESLQLPRIRMLHFLLMIRQPLLVHFMSMEMYLLWNIYPRTPQSSLNGTGVIFTSGGESVSMTINWSTYTVMGYKDSKKCNDELGVEDGSVSDDCYVSVQKNLPLEIIITKVLLELK